MTYKQLFSLASLHSIPLVIAQAMPKSPKAFLQACNDWFSETTPKQLTLWKHATKQQSIQSQARRSYKKCVTTPQRQVLKDQWWTPMRDRLRIYVASRKGAQTHAASFIGTSSSQIHRWVCPVCEHDQEPSYSLGKAVETFLSIFAPLSNQ